MNRSKQIVTAVLVAFGALIVIAFVMNNLAPSPVSAAKAHCVQQGWADHELSLSGFETSAKISGSNGTVRFNATSQDQKMMIRIKLRKALFATKWHIVGYDETDIEKGPADGTEPRICCGGFTGTQRFSLHSRVAYLTTKA